MQNEQVMDFHRGIQVAKCHKTHFDEEDEG